MDSAIHSLARDLITLLKLPVFEIKRISAVPTLVESGSVSQQTQPREEGISFVVAGSEGDQDGEGFLQEMFPTMDADVVRDVLQHVHNDTDKACHQLLVIQVNSQLSHSVTILSSCIKVQHG